jgi:hypothetical protein
MTKERRVVFRADRNEYRIFHPRDQKRRVAQKHYQFVDRVIEKVKVPVLIPLLGRYLLFLYCWQCGDVQEMVDGA